jgi:hypothetical protein
MLNFRLLLFALACICLLALGVFALASDPALASPPIIIKGGSLIFDCGDGKDCLDSSGNGQHSHKNKNGKIHQIVVKDEDGNVLGTFDQKAFPNGKPSIEIYYY